METCQIPCGTPEVPTCPCEAAAERGRVAGALYRLRGYGKVNGVYPSNPYPSGSEDAKQYDAGYEEGVTGT